MVVSCSVLIKKLYLHFFEYYLFLNFALTNACYYFCKKIKKVKALIMQLNNSFDQIKWQGQFFQALSEDLIDPIFQKEAEAKTEEVKVPQDAELESEETEKKSEEPKDQAAISFSFDAFDSDLFNAAMIEHNGRVLNAVQKIFSQELPELVASQSVCVAMTGSDGRREKLCSLSSKIELIVIVSGENLKASIITKIQKVVAQHLSLFHPDLEFKDLLDDSLICYNNNLDPFGVKDYRPFPTRALDALYIVGSSKVMAEYKSQFFNELGKKESKKLLQKFQDSAVRPTVKLLKDEMMKTSSESAIVGMTHIDFVKGELHYDGNRIKATKYSLLRVVQYKMALAICKAVNKGELKQETFLSMPIGILERIDWMAKTKILNLGTEELQTLKKAYSTSLVWFAQAQQRFRKDGIKVSSESVKSLQVVANSILNVGTNAKVFEEQK